MAGDFTGFRDHTERPAPKCNFRDMVNFEIVRDFKVMKGILKDAPYIAFDTETTGLDPSRSRLVGFSFAVDMEKGYYVPIAHQHGENADRKLLRYLAHLIKSGRHILAYNKKFDLNVLQISEKLDIGDCVNVFDVMALVWLRDTDVTMPSLKNATEHFLGWTQPKFAETVGESETFDLITPEDALVYAGLDAVATLGLFEDTLMSHPYLKKIFRIDNLSIEVIRRIEHPEQRIDEQWLDEEYLVCSKKVQELKTQIFQLAGREINPNSRPQIAQVLLELGVELEERTEKGAWKVSLDVLDKYDHPICKVLSEYSQATKYLGSYIKSLRDNVRGSDPVRFNYLAMKAPTGRLACGGESAGKGKQNTYYSPINLQSMPKAKQIERLIAPSDSFVTGWDLLPDCCVQHKDGKRVINTEKVKEALQARGLDETAELYIVETSPSEKGTSAIRNCFIPDDDESCWVSIDYKAEELRIAAGLSGEKIWIDAFNSGKDIHWTTARSVFGEDADSNHRKTSKAINFGALYGGGKWALARTIGCELEEADEYLEKYNDGLPDLAQWKSYMKKKAKKEDLFTFYGRPRRMARYFNSKATWKQRAFGERTALNTVVQGCGADVLRDVLGKIYLHSLKRPDLHSGYSIRSLIHDEGNYSVRSDFLHTFMRVVPKLMTVDMTKHWGLVLEVDISVGKNWGECVGYYYDAKNKRFTPAGEKVALA